MPDEKVIEPELVDPKYSENYTEDDLFNKIKKTAGTIGKEFLIKVFELYYIMKNPSVPLKSKLIITAALGYFILPIDAIPDLAPVIGYADDAAALSAALIFLNEYRTEEIQEKARQKADSLFS